jgi:hypothetical protein
VKQKSGFGIPIMDEPHQAKFEAKVSNGVEWA